MSSGTAGGGAGSSGGGGTGGDPCGPSNCAGCCDEGGACQAGTADVACGLAGAQCATCKNTCGWDPPGPDYCTYGTGVAFFACQNHACAPKLVGNYEGECCPAGFPCNPVTAKCE